VGEHLVEEQRRGAVGLAVEVGTFERERLDFDCRPSL
jgi:hypothetical protein